MITSVAILGVIAVMGTLAVLCFHYWSSAFVAEGKEAASRFLVWTATGLLFPVFAWFLANTGLFASWPPIVPEVALAKYSGGPWIGHLMQAAWTGALLISSYWAATTFAWLLARIWARTRDRKEFLIDAGILSSILLPVAALFVYFGGMVTGAFGALVWLIPVVHFTLPRAQVRAHAPLYASAIARIKFGKYREAEQQVIEQLEKCENDFDGWLMLAELYATRFHELAEADATVRELCQQPGVNAVQKSIALHRLADWHLKHGDDPASARRALEHLRELLPGSHFARMAQLQIDQLPATRQELQEHRKAKTVRLPSLGDDLDTAPAPELSPSEQAEAKRLAELQADKLRRDPNDVVAREKFAVLLAERLDKADLAMEQIELLLALPGQPDAKVAQWLGLQAAWQLKYRGDTAAGKRLLERLIHEYPQTPQAFAAQRRLNLMDMEDRLRKARAEA